MADSTAMASNIRILLVSLAPPQNDCGVRVVLHRHLVERKPFEVHVVTNADFFEESQSGTKLTLPYPLHRLRKSRFGPRMSKWLMDYETQIWPLSNPGKFDKAVKNFKPDAILALADNCLSSFALRAARRHKIPLAGLFLDWVPIMKGHYGHAWTMKGLSRRFRRFYRECDLAFCTSNGMQEVLGPHPNSHVVYPMPGQHRISETISPPKSGKFRLVYVGSVERFYGRMICSLLDTLEEVPDVEIIVVGPNADWPEDIIRRARARGIYLGFKPPAEAAAVLSGADALLVVMSFEPEHRLFMETSFTTKFLDYTSFGKPIILWGPGYCTPARVARRERGAYVVDRPHPEEVLEACRQIAEKPEIRAALARQAEDLHQGLFSSNRLQNVFVGELEKLVHNSQAR